MKGRETTNSRHRIAATVTVLDAKVTGGDTGLVWLFNHSAIEGKQHREHMEVDTAKTHKKKPTKPHTDFVYN